MYNNKQKQVIVAGNDFKIKFSLKKFDDGSYVPFDLSTCTDLHVLLISSQEIDLKYEILQDETDTILATVDYRLVRPNTGYGFAVEGNDADGNHFRWEMRPSEGIYVVTNTSGMHITQDTYILDIEGRVGWGYDGYTKAEIDDKFTAVDNDIDRIDLSIQGIDGDIAELDSIVDGLTGDVADLQTDIQQLQSGIQNINSEVSGIQTDIAELQTGITELQTDISNIENELDNKQDTLTPGNFIEIDDNEISAVGLVDIQEFDEQMQTKQDVLISSQNIKTINHQSILGEGNIEIQGGSGVEQVQTDWNQTDIQAVDYIKNKPDLDEKQDVLTPGNNIEIINNIISATDVVTPQELQTGLAQKQDVLVSAQNIKTINNESILGAGNIEIQAAAQEQADWNQTDIQAVDYIKNKPNIEEYNEVIAIALSEHDSKINYLNNTIPQQISDLTSDTNEKLNTITNTFNSSLSDVNTTIDLLSIASTLSDEQNVKSSTTGLKIEVVNALPAVPADDTIYIVQ